VGQQAFQLNRQAAMSTSALWNQIRERGLATLAVVGMTKNTGKTVALNHLLACAAETGVAIGVTSIGRDGEDRDQVFFTPKPPVLVWSGSVIATARDTLLRAKVRWKLLAATGVGSPMGEIVIVRALDHGEMEIAGASRSSDQQEDHRAIATVRLRADHRRRGSRSQPARLTGHRRRNHSGHWRRHRRWRARTSSARRATDWQC
jgi:hypothetical protein